MSVNHEKPKQAVALNYNQEKDTAPRVVAKGSGYVAEQILALAQKNTVPVYHNKTLTGVLMAIDLDREIPPELYQAIAEVLAHVYRIDQRLGKLPK
ncbi:EscU/YscU/HrcU family type III secretion system export apparatus switch protein [Dendrosporobacter sp. 1207_IL3150]|uniref:EscU/YscU/HrcU family type III secretion system export apparatus switch protein n=1 Tax=Dendrosporobacter sp. 1207_IL3150 TaxID=3084054 RepID=UPI002FD98420